MLKERIHRDLFEAIKMNNELTRSVLRMLNAAILNREKEKRFKIAKTEPELSEEKLTGKSQLADEEIIEVIFSEIKKRAEAALGFEKGKRLESAEKEKKEAGILRRYLPELASEEEIRTLAKAAILKSEAREIKDMGKVMAELMPRLKGKADNALISKVVKELLSAPNL